MGRFYKTAKPELLDFMYQVPEQAILGAIKGADTQIDNEVKYYTDLQKQLKHQALTPDVERQKQLLAKYEDEIKQRAYQITSSPLEALKEKQKIRELGETIYKDVTRGELAAQYANFNARQEYEKRYKEEMMKKDGRINAKQLQDAMTAWDATYAAKEYDEEGNEIKGGGVNYDPVTGDYRRYSPIELASFKDVFINADKSAEGWKADAIKNNYAYVTSDGKWKIKGATGEREASFSDIFDNVKNNMYQDIEQMDFLKQQILINKMAGGKPGVGLTQEQVYGKKEVVGQDANGNDIVDFVYRTYVDDKGKTQYQTDKYGNKIPVYGGMIYDAVYKAAEKHGFKETEKGNTDISETAQYQSDIDEAKQRRLKQYSWDLEHPNANDNQNGEILSNKFSGETIEEIQTNLDGRQNTIKNDILKQANSYYNIIKNSNLKNKYDVKNNVESLINKITATKDPVEAGKLFDQLNTYLGSVNAANGNSIIGLKDIANGVNALKESVISELDDIQNEATALGEIYNAKMQTPEGKNYATAITMAQEEYNILKKQLDKLEKPSKFDTEASRKTSEAYYKLSRQTAQALTKLNAARQAAKTYVNEFIRTTDANGNPIKDSEGLVTQTIFSTAGNVTENMPEVSEEENNEFKQALQEITADDLLNNLLSGTSAKVVINGKGAPISFNTAIEKGLLKKPTKDVDGNIVFVDANDKEVGKFKVNATRIAFLNKKDLGVGENPYQFTLVGLDPKKDKYQGMEIYASRNEIINNRVNKVVNRISPRVTVQNIEDNAKAVGEGLSPNYNYGYTNSKKGIKINYYPNQTSAGVKGLWQIRKPDGTIENVYGNDGKMRATNHLLD